MQSGLTQTKTITANGSFVGEEFLAAAFQILGESTDSQSNAANVLRSLSVAATDVFKGLTTDEGAGGAISLQAVFTETNLQVTFTANASSSENLAVLMPIEKSMAAVCAFLSDAVCTNNYDIIMSYGEAGNQIVQAVLAAAGAEKSESMNFVVTSQYKSRPLELKISVPLKSIHP